jgi:hypothetical protein
MHEKSRLDSSEVGRRHIELIIDVCAQLSGSLPTTLICVARANIWDWSIRQIHFWLGFGLILLLNFNLLQVLCSSLQNVRVSEQDEDSVRRDCNDALYNEFELHVVLYLKVLSFCGQPMCWVGMNNFCIGFRQKVGEFLNCQLLLLEQAI